MFIYLYDEKTKGYLGKSEADSNPEETKLQGKFVPLVPSNATLLAPPEYGENQIPVFEKGRWAIYPDYRGFYKVGKNLEVEAITEIRISGDIIVTRELAQEIQSNPAMFKISENKVVHKDEIEIMIEKISTQKEKFKTEFFKTSLGWIRRKVHMKDGSIKDFLSDFVLLIKAGLEMGQDVEIITYNEPDYKQDITDEYILSLQEIKTATVDFINECLLQTVKDFGLERSV